MKDFFRKCGLQVIRWIGSQIRDCDTGELLGRGLFLIIRGKVHLIGYAGPPVMPVFLSQDQVRYWRCGIGFRRMKEVDFPRVREFGER